MSSQLLIQFKSQHIQTWCKPNSMSSGLQDSWFTKKHNILNLKSNVPCFFFVRNLKVLAVNTHPSYFQMNFNLCFQVNTLPIFYLNNIFFNTFFLEKLLNLVSKHFYEKKKLVGKIICILCTLCSSNFARGDCFSYEKVLISWVRSVLFKRFRRNDRNCTTNLPNVFPALYFH
jgi:hypothetical protein